MKTALRNPQFALALTLAYALPACADDPPDQHGHDTETGDGDGDPTTGDGDGDPSTGDGDGDPTTGDGDGDPTTGDGDGDPSTGDGDGDGLCGTPSCEDAMTIDLGLHADKISDGAITNTATDDVWTSIVDATAGGAMMAPSNPWIYARFGDEGLVRVEIDDIEALDSDAWDIAAKRFGIRVNSGSSGPGCVGVAPFAGDFDEALVAPGTPFASEDFYDDQCALIQDMAGNPNYRMNEWWSYAGCVATTGQVYLLELGDGRHLAFTVDAYYADGQAQCNGQGVMGTGAANVTWRWRFLD